MTNYTHSSIGLHTAVAKCTSLLPLYLW